MDAATQTQPESAWRRGALAFFLVALFLLAFGAWERDLFDADEGRYASVAWNMVDGGDWITPRLNGMPFMDKPPLVYWVQGVLYSTFGRHELFARAPTLLAGALWALFAFLFAGAWSGSRRAAWLAGLLAATSAAGMIGSRVGPQMDMPLAAAVAGALWAGWVGITRGGWRAHIGLGVAVGCGLLIKGPLVVAVSFLVACAWMVAGLAPRRVLKTMFAPLAWAVALAIAGPWYWLVEQANPGWIQHFIEYEHFGRFNEGDHRSFRPFWFYVPIVLLYLAPWTSLAWSGWGSANEGAPWHRRLLGLVTWSPWSPKPWGHALPGAQPGARLGAAPTGGSLAFAWFLVAFLLYSLATRKLLNYLLPAAAPLFMLIGAQLDRRLRKGLSFPWRLPLLGSVVFLAIGAFTAGGLLFPLQTGRLPSDLEAPRWEGLGLWLCIAAVVFAAGIVAVQLLRRRAASMRIVIFVLAGGLGWWCIDHGMARVEHLGSSRRLAAALRASEARWPLADLQEGALAVHLAYKRYPQGLGFYDFPELLIAGGTPDKPEQREIVVRYARPYWEGEKGGLHFLDARGPVTEPEKGAPDWHEENGGKARLFTQAAFEQYWSGELPFVLPTGRGGVVRVVAVVRFGEIAPLKAYILSGPYGGAGRTDLYLVTNLPPDD